MSVSSPDSSISGMFYGTPANPAQQITTGISARCSCTTAGFAKHVQSTDTGTEADGGAGRSNAEITLQKEGEEGGSTLMRPELAKEERGRS